MPELPEVERARAVIEERALGRRIAARGRQRHLRLPPARARRDRRRRWPAPPLTEAHRRGKAMWVETDARAGARPAPGHGRPDRRRRAPGPSAGGTASRSSSTTAGGWRCATGAAWAAWCWSPTWTALGPGRGRGGPQRVPRARGPRHAPAEGPDHGPGRRSPAWATCWPTRRCGGRACRRCCPRASWTRTSSTTCAASCARPPARPIRQGGVHTGDLIPAPRARRRLPALRRGAAPGDRRRAHHLLVPGRPAGALTGAASAGARAAWRSRCPATSRCRGRPRP